MTDFLSASQFVLARCAALGTIPPSILAAKARKPTVAVLTFLIAALVVYVLLAAAVSLHHS